MKVLIEFYDKDVLKNIVAPLTLRPEKVVYLYDNGLRDGTAFRSLETCFRRHMPNIRLEAVPVDILSVPKIRQAVFRVIAENAPADCALELTGGSELMTVGGYIFQYVFIIKLNQNLHGRSPFRHIPKGVLSALFLDDGFFLEFLRKMGQGARPLREFESKALKVFKRKVW